MPDTKGVVVQGYASDGTVTMTLYIDGTTREDISNGKTRICSQVLRHVYRLIFLGGGVPLRTKA